MKTLQDLISFVEAIPDEMLIPNLLYEGDDPTVKQPGCIWGHLNFHFVQNYNPSGEYRYLAHDFAKSLGLYAHDLISANNGREAPVGTTPKQRVLAFLKKKQKEVV